MSIYGNIMTEEEAQDINRKLKIYPRLIEEMKNIIRHAEKTPFLSVGMLVEHHSCIREILQEAGEL